MDDLVIVRAWNGEPRVLRVLSTGDGVVYVASSKSGDSLPPVGVPVEDVFVFDGQAFDAIDDIWKRNNTTTADDWQSLDSK